MYSICAKSWPYSDMGCCCHQSLHVCLLPLYLSHLFSHQSCFCVRYRHFCKIYNKQQIHTSSWGKYPVETFKLIKHVYKHHQTSCSLKFTPLGLGRYLNSTQMYFKTTSFGKGTEFH